MIDTEQVQCLIRLKRHERPPENFVEDFVSSFQDRQRAELLNRSARGLLWERITTYFDDLLQPKWALAGATAVAALFAVWVMHPVASGPQVAGNRVGAQAPFEVRGAEIMPVEDEAPDIGLQRYLLSNHYSGGFFNEQKPSGMALPAGFRRDLNGGHFPR